MQLLRSILVAVDGSGPSNAALAVTCSLAQQFGAEAHGCHVLATHPYLQGRHIQWLPEVESEKRREAAAIARAAERAAATRGIDVRVAVADGDPIEEVLRPKMSGRTRSSSAIADKMLYRRCCSGASPRA